MELLALCSKTLFDHEILNKQREIFELRDALSPRPFFDSPRQWHDAVDASVYRMTETVRACVADHVGYIFLRTGKILQTCITLVLEKELSRLSRQPVWAETTTRQIVLVVDAVFNLIRGFDGVRELFFEATTLERALVQLFSEILTQVTQPRFPNLI